jgi:hypothetical protein
MQDFLYCFMEDQTHFDIPRMMPKQLWSLMDRYRKLLVQTSSPSPSMPPRLTKHGNFCMQNNQLVTKIQDELTDNSNILFGFSKSSRLCPLPDSICSSGTRKRKKQVQWCERLSLDDVLC